MISTVGLNGWFCCQRIIGMVEEKEAQDSVVLHCENNFYANTAAIRSWRLHFRLIWSEAQGNPVLGLKIPALSVKVEHLDL